MASNWPANPSADVHSASTNFLLQCFWKMVERKNGDGSARVRFRGALSRPRSDVSWVSCQSCAGNSHSVDGGEDLGGLRNPLRTLVRPATRESVIHNRCHDRDRSHYSRVDGRKEPTRLPFWSTSGSFTICNLIDGDCHGLLRGAHGASRRCTRSSAWTMTTIAET